MCDLPQELVDKVIDDLNESLLLEQHAPDASSQNKLSDYSTVSKRWVNRTQYHHFRSLHFTNYRDMEKWRKVIKPDPFGVSRHVRTLHWHHIDILDGFEGHLRALTNIEEATFDGCSFFWCFDDVLFLRHVASNLAELTISNTTTTPSTLSSFLALSPHLRRLHIECLWIESDDTPAVSPDNIPFFKGANNLTLVLEDHRPGGLSWVPSTVRFTNLGVGNSFILHDPDLLNGWITSSSETLERFDVHWESEFDDLDFAPLDLSGCARLRTLQLPLLFNKPELFSDAISSITSPGLSTITLYLACVGSEEADHHCWRILEESLCQRAKQFRTLQGEKMLVEINLEECRGIVLPPLFGDGGLLQSLGEEARIVMNVKERASYSPGALSSLGGFWDPHPSFDIYDEVNGLDYIYDPLASSIPEATPGGPTYSSFAADIGLSDDDLQAHWWSQEFGPGFHEWSDVPTVTCWGPFLW